MQTLEEQKEDVVQLPKRSLDETVATILADPQLRTWFLRQRGDQKDASLELCSAPASYDSSREGGKWGYSLRYNSTLLIEPIGLLVRTTVTKTPSMPGYAGQREHSESSLGCLTREESLSRFGITLEELPGLVRSCLESTLRFEQKTGIDAFIRGRLK